MEGVEKRRERVGGGRDSAGLSTLQRVLVLEQSRQQDKGTLGAEQGCEMFPPHPETGGNRNPTGNLTPMEPLTWPWYGALRRAVLPARCIPLALRARRGHCRDPTVSPPLGGQKGGPSGRQSKPNRAVPVRGALAGMLLPLFRQISVGGLRSRCCVGTQGLAGVQGQAGARCLCPRTGNVPRRLLVRPGYRCPWGVHGGSLFLLLLCLPSG